jgi:benzoyl-CoA reductase/2-hydroxyglutaryl-CoA dehydratase subunit BcrC/BadD/HgdB
VIKLQSNKRLVKTIRNQVLWTRMGSRLLRRPVAWVTSGSPVELVMAAGFIPFYPENHAAICAARGMSQSLAEATESDGYSRDLCSYFRVDVGSQRTGMTPLGHLVKPDLILASNNICGTVQNWFRVTAEHYNVPMLFLDTPFNDGAPAESDLAYVRDQIVALMAEASRHGIRKVTEASLKEYLMRSREALMLWSEVLDSATATPAPFTSFDAFVHMAPIVSMRGTRRCVSYYRALLDEVRERARKGIGSVPDERARVVWDNIAIWPAHKQLKKLFEVHRVALVADTYTSAWSIDALDPNDPVTSMARAYTDIILNHGVAHRVDVISEKVQRFGAQGFVLHSNRSCKRYSLGQYGVKQAVAARTGATGVVVEADMADPRSVSFEHLQQRLVPFFEVLGASA